MAFCSGLVVRSPGSIKALNQSTHNSLGHCWNVHLAVAGHCRKFILLWLATVKWTFRQWLRELWVDWFNALTEPGDQTTRPLPNAVSAVAWTQAQVVNSNSTSRVKEIPNFGMQMREHSPYDSHESLFRTECMKKWITFWSQALFTLFVKPHLWVGNDPWESPEAKYEQGKLIPHLKVLHLINTHLWVRASLCQNRIYI